MYNGATEDTPDKAQQGLLTERGMPPCILLIASRPALRERDIGTVSYTHLTLPTTSRV